jgi:hypothetical protein
MFKILRRIEALMTKFVENETECLTIVKRREIDFRLQEGIPWKCEWPECTESRYHLHVIVEQSAPKPRDEQS